MRITERQVGHVVAVTLSGRLSGWKAAGLLDECLRRNARAGTRTFIADFGAVSAVDSVGLDAVIRGCRILRAIGGELRIVALTRRIDDLIVITRLATLCDTFDTVANALDGLVQTGFGVREYAAAPEESLGMIPQMLPRH